MKGIYFKQKRIEEEGPENYECSKLLGSPVFPEGFLGSGEDYLLTDDDFFIMQLNLSDVKGCCEYLPDSGFLYFFLDVDDLTPKVLYTEDEVIEVIDDINECFDGEYGKTDAYELVFGSEDQDGHLLLGELDEDIGLEGFTDTDGYVTLLQIDALELPDEILRLETICRLDGYFVFLIKEEDLKRRDFSRVIFVDCGT